MRRVLVFLVALLVFGCSRQPTIKQTFIQDQTPWVKKLDREMREEWERRESLEREMDGQRILIQQLQMAVGDLQRRVAEKEKKK